MNYTDYLGEMNENDFTTLIREIGLNMEDAHGDAPDLAARLNDSIEPTISLSNVSQQSLSPSHSNPRRPLATVSLSDAL